MHRLLGGAQDRIRTYIAGGYYADDVVLMVDANCALDLPTAMEFAR